MAITPFDNALLRKFGETGDDGVTDNDKRTQALFVGGHEFTIVFKDSAALQSDLKIQVNNSNRTDPHKAHHSVHPSQLALQSTTDVLVDAGVFGGVGNQQKETSASASDFATNWIDMPGGAGIDESNAAYVASGSWRYVRLVSTGEMNPTLSGYVWSRELNTNV